MPKTQNNKLDGEIINIRRGLAIYKVHFSPYYRARIRDAKKKGYIVRSTKETSRIKAREAAEELAQSLTSHLVTNGNSEARFSRVAENLIERERQKGERGEVHKRLYGNTAFYLTHKTWGASDHFGTRLITDIKTVDYNAYMDFVRSKAPNLSASSMNHIASSISKVFKLARDLGIIDTVPDTPRVRRVDNPRPYFKFSPLVDKDKDEYQLLLRTARELAMEKVKVRENIIDDELYDMVVFLTHSFLRPIESEFYELKHRDVTVQDNPKTLQIILDKGKTGRRISNTLEAGVTVYERICKRNPDYKPDDYLFFPQYRNRNTARRNTQRIFNHLLHAADLKTDETSGNAHTLYSLRHTAICMRLVNSKGKVNVDTLAKNAGTSVNQIERFYANKLPLQGELIRNLQSFGD